MKQDVTMAMDQDIIHTFISCYLRNTSRKLICEMVLKEKANVKEFRKKYNTEMTII
jgi:hypothetical protein